MRGLLNLFKIWALFKMGPRGLIALWLLPRLLLIAGVIALVVLVLVVVALR